jgi:hypothetical protein
MTDFFAPDPGDPSGGGTMTEPRQEQFMHNGGPYDGEAMLVEVDDNGVPIELHIVSDMSGIDPSRNSFGGPTVDVLSSMYERTEVFGDEGFTYVYQFRGQDNLDAAA